MKKLLLFFLLYSLHITAQYKVDTIIKSDAYISYFSNVLKEPLYVTYTLSKGGGDCDRSKFKFKNFMILVLNLLFYHMMIFH